MLRVLRYVVTNADKAGNTKVYQGLKAGKKVLIWSQVKNMYVAAASPEGSLNHFYKCL